MDRCENGECDCECLLFDVPKVATGAMRFFLGIDQQIESLENDDEAQERQKFDTELPKVKKRQHAKLTRKRKRQMERAVRKVKKHRMKMRGKEMGEETAESKVLLKAIEIIHDPQSFTEKLFKRLRGSKCPFETKLMMMDLVSRLTRNDINSFFSRSTVSFNDT